MSAALFDAIRSNSIEQVKDILQDHPDGVHDKDQRGSTPLLLATYYGHKEIVDVLLSHKPEINAQDGSGNTALIAACRRGWNLNSLMTVKVLVEE